MSSLVIKLAIVGGKNSGKSALAVRFLTRRFIGEYDSNSDVCIKRNIQLAGKSVELHIKDTAGSIWLKGPAALVGWSSAIVIVYSVTDPRSFSLAKYILEEMNICKKVDQSFILLLGNKKDLNHLREVTHSQGKKLAKKHGIHFEETSAANDFESVDNAFKKLLFVKILAFSKIPISIEPNQTKAFTRKLSLNNHELSQRKINRIRRTSTGSFDSAQESISSVSDDEGTEIYNRLIEAPKKYEDVTCKLQVGPNIKNRKISLPHLFGRTQKLLKAK
ncbi:ras-related and estrogen-regulated growth inhibitor-like protein [Hydra vulgaris]|uniref:small monomeric GTPase n=1 Tax=Hydra vulgaris TaxID=6087 RepID=A0ABM4D3P0_HYDVU